MKSCWDAEDNRATEQHMSAQGQWDVIVEATHKSAQVTQGKRKNEKLENQKVRKLSEKQKTIL